MTKQNRVYAALPTKKNLGYAETMKYSFANADHILFVTDETPKIGKEVKDDLLPLLKEDDWDWIYSVSEEILREQQDAFLARFEKELTKKKVVRDAKRKETEEHQCV